MTDKFLPKDRRETFKPVVVAVFDNGLDFRKMSVLRVLRKKWGDQSAFVYTKIQLYGIGDSQLVSVNVGNSEQEERAKRILSEMGGEVYTAWCRHTLETRNVGDFGEIEHPMLRYLG